MAALRSAATSRAERTAFMIVLPMRCRVTRSQQPWFRGLASILTDFGGDELIGAFTGLAPSPKRCSEDG
jgi:hypothetical protein